MALSYKKSVSQTSSRKNGNTKTKNGGLWRKQSNAEVNPPNN